MLTFARGVRLIHTTATSVRLRQGAMDLRSLVGHMEAVVPCSRAESWDNVGLLVEPSGNPSTSCVLLTVDLTEEVLREAKQMGAGLVVSYHPPIFQPLKRLTQQSSKERVVVQALESGIAVYSPHTALDCMEDGVNDWLLAGLGRGNIHALTTHLLASTPDRVLSVHGVEKERVEALSFSGAVSIKPSPRSVL